MVEYGQYKGGLNNVDTNLVNYELQKTIYMAKEC